MFSASALRYSDDSVLEHHHLESAFSLLHQPRFNFLRALTSSEYRTFRTTVVAMVLATDLKRHFEFISRLKSLKPGALSQRVAPEKASAEDAGLDTMLALEVAIKFCDLGHVTKPWALHERWTSWVTEELYLLGDSQRLTGCGISALCDREKDTDVPKNQIGFFSFVCIPFYTACARAWPETEAVGATPCKVNFEVWQTRLTPSPAPSSVRGE